MKMINKLLFINILNDLIKITNFFIIRLALKNYRLLQGIFIPFLMTSPKL